MGDSNDILPSGTTGLTEYSSRGMAITAFVFSLFGFIPLIGAVFSITAIVLGIISLVKKRGGSGFAIAAIIIGSIFLVLQPLIVIYSIAFLLVLGLNNTEITNSSYSGGLGVNSFVISPPFSAKTSSIVYDSLSESAFLNFELMNSGGSDVNINSIYIDVTNPVSASCSINVQNIIYVGYTESFSAECFGVKRGDNFNAKISIIYNLGQDPINRNVVGTISGKVGTI